MAKKKDNNANTDDGAKKPAMEIGYVKPRKIEDEMRQSYLDYAMSVIVSRALPDARDGLKPVHRRVLYAMNGLGLRPSARYRKSATVVGEVLGKYHPHGDVAVYDSLVRLAQNFAMRYPLVDGQGNFGSMDGDSAAAMRYCITGDSLVATEAGLLPIKDIVSNQNEPEQKISLRILSKNKALNKAVRWFDSGNHPTTKITTQHGYSISGSANHPILVWTKNESSPKLKWKLLDQLKLNDVAVIDRTADFWPNNNIQLSSYIPKVSGRREIKTLPKMLDKPLAHILGGLLAEGSIKEKEIEFCNSDAAWLIEFRKYWSKAFPDCRLHHFHRQPNSYGKKPYQTYEIHSGYVIEFLRNLGLSPVKSAEKQIPHSVLQSPKPIAAEFLRAYFEGDGSISFSGKMTELSAISKSELLISQLQILLLKFGIAAAKRFDSYRNTHKLYIRGLKNYKLFQEQIGFVSSKKNNKLFLAISRISKDYSQSDFIPYLQKFTRSELYGKYDDREFVLKHNFDRYGNLLRNQSKVLTTVNPAVKNQLKIIFDELLENQYLFDPIVRIEKPGIQRVYSIKVDSPCHSFVANGFVNHNTESRMAPIAEQLLADLDKGTVDWMDNYDATRKEPKVLPARLPNLLVNGTLGIAVGMATDIPPHNLREIVDATNALIGNPKLTSEDLMEFVSGPDFPTGGIIYDWEAIKSAYATGKGGVVTRAKTEIVENNAGNYQILITEIPYRVNKATLLQKFADLVRDKKIEGIRDLRDESDKDGVRIVIDLKKEASPNKILNQLFNFTQLQDTFHLNMVALVDGIEPRVLNLKQLIEHFIAHRRQVVVRRTRFDLQRAKDRAHILEGLKKALDQIDAIIKAIKKSETKEIAHAELVKKFKLSDKQATAILEMRLQQLAGLERKKIEDELKEKLQLIGELELLLKSPKKIDGVIGGELAELKEKFGDARKTQLVKAPLGEFKAEDLIVNEEAIIVVTKSGYVKRLSPDTYRSQGRGGKGVIGITTKEADEVEHLSLAETHDDVLFFTNKGRVFQTKVYELPQTSRTAKGQALVNFLELGAEEHATAVLTIGKQEKDKYKFLFMGTTQGTIKKTESHAFEKVRRSGLIAINLSKGDELKWVRLTTGADEIMMTTAKGQAIRFKETDARPMGRTARGVRGIRLKKDDRVMSLDVIEKASDPKNLQALVISEFGMGKRTDIKQYKTQKRGGSGIRTMNVNKKTGEVKVMHIISRAEEADIIVISKHGQTIRTAIGQISTLGRATQGVRIMKLDQDDKVASATIV